MFWVSAICPRRDSARRSSTRHRALVAVVAVVHHRQHPEHIDPPGGMLPSGDLRTPRGLLQLGRSPSSSATCPPAAAPAGEQPWAVTPGDQIGGALIRIRRVGGRLAGLAGLSGRDMRQGGLQRQHPAFADGAPGRQQLCHPHRRDLSLRLVAAHPSRLGLGPCPPRRAAPLARGWFAGRPSRAQAPRRPPGAASFAPPGPGEQPPSFHRGQCVTLIRTRTNWSIRFGTSLPAWHSDPPGSDRDRGSLRSEADHSERTGAASGWFAR